MTTPEILDKIKKLLRLGQSPNRHEAELAVQRAFELASRHQIDIESVSLEDDVRKIIAENFPSGKRLSFARKLVLNLLQNYFNVNAIIIRSRTNPHITFIGKPVDIQIAIYVHEFLHTACATNLKEFIRSCRRKPARSTQENYLQGFIWGVSSKLREAKGHLAENQTGLIVAEDARRQAYEDSLFAGTKLMTTRTEVTRENRAAAHLGFIAGERVHIRKPIESNAAGQLLLS
jgi:hypothetical protein